MLLPREAGVTASRDAASAVRDAAARPSEGGVSAGESGQTPLTTHSPRPLDGGETSSEEPRTTPDASLVQDAGVAADAAVVSQCEVDACNDLGTCIERAVWTVCDCETTFLPTCTRPLFRVIGQSRTDQERALYLLSGDGHVAAGVHAFDARGNAAIGVTWSRDEGLMALEQDPRGPTVPTAINEDGSLITGFVALGAGDKYPVSWRKGALEFVSPDAGGLQEGNERPTLPPDPNGHDLYVLDATPDGAVLVGKARRTARPSSAEAAIWTQEGGVRFLREMLEAEGVDMNKWDLWHVDAVSDDGTTMIGLGIGPDAGYRWYLRLPVGL